MCTMFGMNINMKICKCYKPFTSSYKGHNYSGQTVHNMGAINFIALYKRVLLYMQSTHQNAFMHTYICYICKRSIIDD
jgi:hypothetical protein